MAVRLLCTGSVFSQSTIGVNLYKVWAKGTAIIQAKADMKQHLKMQN